MKDLKQLKATRLAKEQVASNRSLEKQIEALRQAIESQEPIDLTDITDKLTELSESLRLEPLFKSLEESIHATSLNLSKKTNTPDFSKLLESIKQIKQPVVKVATKADNILDEYNPSDMEVGDVTSYYGFLHPTGKWYIMRQNGTASVNFRYATGVREYTTAWRNKENHTYSLFDEVAV